MLKILCAGFAASSAALLIATIILAVQDNSSTTTIIEEPEPPYVRSYDFSINSTYVKAPMAGTNSCEGKKVKLENTDCYVNDTVAVIGQAGANVTEGYVGDLDMTDTPPFADPYWTTKMCPVNVHWHLGAEHLSVGEFDDMGSGPDADDDHRVLAEDARLGGRCHHYDKTDAKFTTEYDWQHCNGMHVGETYEVHWPHSAAGACGTPDQYQTPFYDGVFCNVEALGDLSGLQNLVAVQGQVFTIVNDETYYYPDLMRGMLVDEGNSMGTSVTKYTGSTTGTSRDNTVCSTYAPITWQVDRKCHMVSASTFDKMCADMKIQRDDMSDDLYPHGSRIVVDDALAANNQVNRDRY